MKKYVVGFSIFLILLIYFYKQNEPELENTSTLHQAHIETSKKTALPKQATLADSTSSDKNQTPSAKKISCAEKIVLQNPKSEKYTEQIRQKLNAVVGSWYYEENKTLDLAEIKETTTSGKFFLALAHADHIRGSKIYKNADSIKALSLLHEVMAEDPTNSAPLIFAASIYAKLGYAKKSQELIRNISQTTRFDSYLKGFITALYKDVQTSSEYMSASYVWGGAPIPDYSTITKLKLDSSNTSVVGNQLVRDGLNSGKESIETEWIAIEYAYGKKILKDIKQGQQYPSFQDLYKKKQNQFGSLAESFDDDNCDPTLLENIVARINTYFSLK